MSAFAPTTAALLTGVAFVAGVVDAIAGGGGLVTVPALLLALPTPAIALGTNKGQSVFGSGSSLFTYARAGRVDRVRAGPAFLGGLLGSLAGVRLLLWIRPDALKPIVLCLLLLSALFFAWPRRKTPRPPSAAVSNPPKPGVAFLVALALGVYDGFFGPGVGTFLIAAGVALFGDDLTHATANAKVSNFGSNLGSVASFALAGVIDWRLSLPMAVGQTLGGLLGARLALRGGDRVVRVVVLCVSFALVAKLGADLLR